MHIETTVVVTMSASEFDALVHKHYPNRDDYCLCAEELMGADQTWSADVSLTDCDEEWLREWADEPPGIRCWLSVTEICADLIRQEVFPAGRIVIDTY
jgi:hypothetical protein